MNKNATITYTKAIGIMLMVLCHCSNFDFLNRFVYMFHMPLFFILAGYCFNTKYLEQPHKFVWRRIKGLYWPYVKYSLIFLLFHNVFFHVNIYNDKYGHNSRVSHLYTTSEYIDQARDIIFHMGGAHYNSSGWEMLLDAYWFLNSLFWGSLIAFSVLWIFHLMLKKRHNTKTANIIKLGTVMFLLFYVNCPYRTFTIFYIGPRAVLAAVFFLTGYMPHIYGVRRFKPLETICSTIVIFIGSYFWHMETAYLHYNINYIAPYIITAILGTWSIYSFPWNKIPNSLLRIIDYIGSHTLPIVTWHFLSFKIVSLLIIKANNLPIEMLACHPVINSYTNQGWFILYFFIGISAPLALSFISEKAHYYMKEKVEQCLQRKL